MVWQKHWLTESNHGHSQIILTQLTQTRDYLTVAKADLIVKSQTILMVQYLKNFIQAMNAAQDALTEQPATIHLQPVLA